MTFDRERIGQLLQAARARGDRVLLEPDGLHLLDAMGLPVPPHRFVRSSAEVAAIELSRFDGDRLVVKVVSPHILHKSDVGGVAVVANSRPAVEVAIRDMEARLDGKEVAGFTINEFVDYDRSLGSELLIGLRWTEDFGAVVTVGAGGIHTEFLADSFKTGRELALLSPARRNRKLLRAALGRVAAVRLATEPRRGQPARLDLERLVDVVDRFLMLAEAFAPADIVEAEANPMVVTPRGLVALDILVKLGTGPRAPVAPRPLAKLQSLLEPQSAAIIGVSDKLNPGHIILNNLIREGFPREQISIVKPASDQIEGCRCVPDIRSLPSKVDLFILSVAAAQVPAIVTEVVEQQKAESLIVIPGGLEEKEGTGELVARMRAVLAEARHSDWGGPVINGGNCLGIRSLPGRYDTMFIPEYKLPAPQGRVSPVAIVSQSGAFAICRMSKLPLLNPKYCISVGNQMDVTIGDYLTYLKDDPDIEVFAVYVEGFRPLDGLAFLDAASAITASGRPVILYRAGRTAAGAQASASHTAAMAGDFAVTRELVRQAGVIVAESEQDFDDLIRLSVLLSRRRIAGWRLGAVSNAGFECVSMADSLGRFELARFSRQTETRLQQVLRTLRIDTVVDVHNPLDLTPMAGDAAYEEAVRTVIDAGEIDVAVVGLVPLAPTLNTLPAAEGHSEDVTREDSLAGRIARVYRESSKALVAIVDAGALYDPMVRVLDQYGVPTFRTADVALRLFDTYCAWRLEYGR